MADAQSFLFATFEGGGAVTPLLHVVEKLTRRGHRVRVMSDACNRPESEAAGARFVAWTRAPSRTGRAREFDTFNDWEAASPQEGFMNLMDALLVGPAQAFAEDLIDELKREGADLVVSNEMLFGVHAGCEAVGQRLALLAVNIAVLPLPGFPPMGPGLRPACTPEDRALHAAITEDIHHMLDSALPRLNAARTALGLGPLARLVHQHDAAECLLLATSRAFDFGPEVLPPKVRYVGPQLGEPSWTQTWNSPFPREDVRPLALVAFSTTFQDHAGVLQRVIDAISTLPMKAVVTLGGVIRTDEVRGTDNVAVMESAPHNEVLRDANLVVTHGGHGTVMKALAHGKPMLVIPHGRDQNDNAARLAERGAGLTLARTASVADIRAALHRLLNEPSFAAASRELGAKVAKEAANSLVVEVLEGLASGRSDRLMRCA